MGLSELTRRWWLFAAITFALIGLMLANLRAGPVGDLGGASRYAFWLATAAATFGCWWLSQVLVVSGRERLSRGLLIASSLVATLLFVPFSLAIDVLFALREAESSWYFLLLSEWLESALPIAASCMIASLPAWLATAKPPVSTETLPASQPAVVEPTPAGTVSGRDATNDSDAGLLPLAVRGGVLRATADLQYVHLLSPEGITTVPGPMHRVVDLLDDLGLEIRRGDWVADRHVKQLKSVRGRWVVLLKDGQQAEVSRRRVPEVKKRWGSTRFT
jgi:hypothetical protein